MNGHIAFIPPLTAEALRLWHALCRAMVQRGVVRGTEEGERLLRMEARAWRRVMRRQGRGL